MTEFTFDTSKPETVFNAMLAAFGMSAAPAPAPKAAKPVKRAAAKNVKRAARKVSAPIEHDFAAPAIVEYDGMTRKLVTYPADEFPGTDLPAMRAYMRISGAELLANFQDIAFAISTEETRYYLNGVFLHVRDGAAVMVATDGHKLARITPQTIELAEESPDLIIPRCATGAIVKAKLKPAEWLISANRDANRVMFAMPGFTLCTKTIDGTYPDYMRVIPTSGKYVAKIKSADLSRVLERLPKDTLGVAFRYIPAEGAIEVNASGAATRIPAEISGAPPADPVGFQWKYLRQVVRSFRADSLTFAGEDNASPHNIVGDRPDMDGVIMPLRV